MVRGRRTSKRGRSGPGRLLSAGPSAALLVALQLLGARASAHESDFILSRDWELPKLGEHEFEAWSNWVPRSNDFEQQFKYEYGVTDHFAIEPSVEFKKLNAEAFELQAAELEAYFNFRDFGVNKLLPALEAEFEHCLDDDEDEEDEVARNELKLRGILSWYTPASEDFTVNAIVTRRLDGDVGWEGELTAGYLRPLDFIPGVPTSLEHPLKVGLEFSQSLSEDHATQLGPVFTWRVTENLHVVFTALFSLNHRDEHFDELRLLLEWEF